MKEFAVSPDLRTHVFQAFLSRTFAVPHCAHASVLPPISGGSHRSGSSAPGGGLSPTGYVGLAA